MVGRIRARFTHKNPKHAKLRRMGFYPGKGEPALIETWETHGSEISVPRGGMRTVRAELRKAGIPFTVDDRRCSGEWHRKNPLSESLRPYDYQERCIDLGLAAEQGIIKSPTGSGKTSLILALAARAFVPTLIVVHTGALLKQWVSRAESELGYRPGVVGLGQYEPRFLTIAMQQTINRMAEDRWASFAPKFGALICDEVHLFGAATFAASVDRFPAKYRIGTSADHRRADRKDFLISDLFGSPIAEISLGELVDRQFVHDVEVVCLPTEFEAPWYVESRKKDDETEADEEAPQGPLPGDYTRLVGEMAGDAGRNSIASQRAAECAQAGHRVLVWTARVEHAKELSEAISKLGQATVVMVGGDAAEFERSRAEFSSGRAPVAVGTYQAIGTGIDLPSADRGVVTVPFATPQIWGQVRGRLSRTSTGKTDARAFYLWDKRVFDLAPVRRMRSWNAKCYVEQPGGEVEVKEFLKSWKGAA